MDGNMSRILQELTGAARDAADRAVAAASAAREAVSDKYDAVKMTLEHSRLEDEQEDIFSDIGRMMFLMHTGKITDTVMTDDGPRTPKQVIDALLLSAEQIGQQMDAIEARLACGEAGRAPEPPAAAKPCPHCGHPCADGDNFCAACGGKLAPQPGGANGNQPGAPEKSPAKPAAPGHGL